MVFHDDCGCARDYNHKHFEKDDDDSKEYDYVENDDDGCVNGKVFTKLFKWKLNEPCLQGKINWQRLMQTILIFFYRNLRNLFQIIRNWIGYIDIWCEMSDVDCLQGHRVPQLLCSNAANFTAETCSTSTCKAVLVKFSLKQNLEVFSKIWGCCRQLGMASASVPVVLIADLWKVMKVYQLPPNNSNL